MRTTPPRIALLAFGMVVAGCSAAQPENEAATPAAPTTSSPTASPSNDPDGATQENDAEKEDSMRVEITIGEQRFDATLTESAAAHDLLAQLPAMVDMIDHGGVEKTGPLPSPLSLEGQPEGADPSVGDLGYYAPGNDLVLYYGDQSYFAGIVILGRLEGDAAQRISELGGPVTARVEAHDG